MLPITFAPPTGSDSVLIHTALFRSFLLRSVFQRISSFVTPGPTRSVADSLVLILVLLKQNMHFKQDAWLCCFDYTIAGMMLLISSHMADMFLLAASFIPIPYP